MKIFKTQGTCSREIHFELEEGKITHLEFVGGCSGNLQGVSKLAIGREASELISLLKGIQCRNNTSCPDQLSRALENCLNEN